MFHVNINQFPTEIIQKMNYYKKLHGYRKGFNINQTTEGRDFWLQVIERKNFDLFFEKYPKTVI